VRILFVAHGPAHVPWTVPLAWAAQLAGHEVRVAARPQALPKVAEAGLIAVPIGAAAAGDAFARWAAPPSGSRARRVPAQWPSGPLNWAEEKRLSWADQVLALADALADDLVAYARWWRPQLVVHDVGAVAGLVAAEAAGVPAVAHNWCQPLGLYFLHEEEVPPAYERLFQRFGLRPRIGGDVWIDATPPSLAVSHPVPRLPMRYTVYNGPGALAAWTAADPERPRVCVTGGIATDAAGGFARQLVTEVADLDVEIVLALANPVVLGGAALPANVRLTRPVPLGALLGTSAVLVQHGGAGSSMTALARGVPQLVLPEASATTQSLWADQIAAAGAGRGLLPAERSPGSLRAALLDLLHRPEYAARALGISAEIAAMPSPAELIRNLETRVAAS